MKINKIKIKHNKRDSASKKQHTTTFTMKIHALLTLTRLILGWILKVFTTSDSVHLPMFDTIFNKFKNVSSRGPEAYIKYVKDQRQQLIFYLSEEYPAKRVEGVQIYVDGIPRILGVPLAKELRRTKHHFLVRMLLTVFFCSRALCLGKVPDISTITSPTKIVEPERVKTSYRKHVGSFWREFGYKSKQRGLPKRAEFKSYHLSSKSGPNGHALWTSWTDFLNLTDGDKKDLTIVGGEKLGKFLTTLTTCAQYLCTVLPFPYKGKLSRKISYFPDTEMKVRVIAIGDYFTQTALKPLHHYLFGFLRKIPQDCTFNQGSFEQRVKHWPVYHSVDLTAFTDRFPIWFISDVLKGRFTDEYVEAWERLMVGKPFSYKNESIYYTVGTPMGIYTSWNASSLSHHYIMYHCYKELGYWRHFADVPYCLLGDDIVIGDTELADMYQRIIFDLGVEISPLKSHTSFKLFEFAKRYFLDGIEVTPFPVSAIKEVQKRFYLLVNLFRELGERNWEFRVGVPEAVELFYEMVRGQINKKLLNKKFLKEMNKRSHLCNQVMKMTRGEITADNCLYEIVRNNFPTLDIYNFIVTDGSAEGCISSLAVEAFADSQKQFDKGRGYPLGHLAEVCVMRITACEDYSIIDSVFDSIPSIPILHVYGRISESYIAVQKEAYRIDTTGGGDWPFLLRSMAMPLDDRIFVERQSHMISRASAIIADKILERCQLIKDIYGI